MLLFSLFAILVIINYYFFNALFSSISYFFSTTLSTFCNCHNSVLYDAGLFFYFKIPEFDFSNSSNWGFVKTDNLLVFPWTHPEYISIIANWIVKKLANEKICYSAIFRLIGPSIHWWRATNNALLTAERFVCCALVSS